MKTVQKLNWMNKREIRDEACNLQSLKLENLRELLVQKLWIRENLGFERVRIRQSERETPFSLSSMHFCTQREGLSFSTDLSEISTIGYLISKFGYWY
jgi:hypothetical protein